MRKLESKESQIARMISGVIGTIGIYMGLWIGGEYMVESHATRSAIYQKAEEITPEVVEEANKTIVDVVGTPTGPLAAGTFFTAMGVAAYVGKRRENNER